MFSCREEFVQFDFKENKRFKFVIEGMVNSTMGAVYKKSELIIEKDAKVEMYEYTCQHRKECQSKVSKSHALVRTGRWDIGQDTLFIVFDRSEGSQSNDMKFVIGKRDISYVPHDVDLLKLKDPDFKLTKWKRKALKD